MRQGWRSSVSRITIIRRSRNQCGLCGFPVRSNAEPAWRGTLDHIVPLSLGGLHREENVQLAHFVCNAIKGNCRPGWEERLAVRLRTNSPFAGRLAEEVKCG